MIGVTVRSESGLILAEPVGAIGTSAGIGDDIYVASA